MAGMPDNLKRRTEGHGRAEYTSLHPSILPCDSRIHIISLGKDIHLSFDEA